MTTTPPTDVAAEELDAEPTAFLRITGTYPAAGGRASTVELQMNLDDGQPIADVEDTDAAVKSWLTNLCTEVITALRAGPHPPELRITGNAVSLLADRMRHAEDCEGECGQQLPLTQLPPTPPGQQRDACTGGA
jgi:hypothetical protein